MGRKSREKKTRAAQRSGTTATRAGRNRRVALIVTAAALVLVAGIVVAVTLATRPRAVATEAPALAGEARATLDKAADAIRFRPTAGAGVGLVEGMSADTPRRPDSPTLLAVGTQAPDFTLQTATGETVHLADYRGRTVLLEFFATWCPHCQAEAPHLARIHANLDPSRYAIVSVNGNSEDAASVHAYDRFYGLEFPTLLDPGGTPGTYYRPGGAGVVSRAYRIAVFPTFYIVGPDGRISWRADGEVPNALILRELERASAR